MPGKRRAPVMTPWTGAPVHEPATDQQRTRESAMGVGSAPAPPERRQCKQHTERSANTAWRWRGAVAEDMGSLRVRSTTSLWICAKQSRRNGKHVHLGLEIPCTPVPPKSRQLSNVRSAVPAPCGLALQEAANAQPRSRWRWPCPCGIEPGGCVRARECVRAAASLLSARMGVHAVSRRV